MSRLQIVINNRNSPAYEIEHSASGRASYISRVYFPKVGPNTVTAFRLWNAKVGEVLRLLQHIGKYPWESLNV